MAWVTGFFRLVDGLVPPGATAGTELYATLRTILISLAMAGIIAFLAIQYRTDYEAKLQTRNDELEATRDFLSRIIAGSAEGIITRDATGRITSWNQAADAIYGCLLPAFADPSWGENTRRFYATHLDFANYRDSVWEKLTDAEKTD